MGEFFGAILGAVLGAVFATIGGFCARYFEIHTLQGKQELLSDVTKRRVDAFLQLLTLFNDVGVKMNVWAYGPEIMNFERREIPGPSAAKRPSDEARPAAEAALQAFYGFVAANAPLVGASTMRTFFWFRRSVQGISLYLGTGGKTYTDYQLGQVARDLMHEAQDRFTKNAADYLGDGGISILRPDEILKINAATQDELEAKLKKVQPL